MSAEVKVQQVVRIEKKLGRLVRNANSFCIMQALMCDLVSWHQLFQLGICNGKGTGLQVVQFLLLTEKHSVSYQLFKTVGSGFLYVAVAA